MLVPEIPVPNLDAKPAAAPSPAAASPDPAPASPKPDVPADPSPAPDVSADPSPAPGVTPASPTEPSEPKSELLKAVTKAIKPEKKPDEAAKPETEAQNEPDQDAEPDLPSDPTPEEMKGYTAKTQRRINQLLTERNAAYQRVAEIEPFREYMADNELSGEDLAFSLHALATLRKGDYEGFLQQVQPFVQMALEYTGRSLPPDLQDQVRAGKVAPEVAVTVARQRYDLGDARQRLERQNAETQQQAEENARQANRSAVQTWEQSIKTTDPDYARKLDVAKAFVTSIRAERGDPTTPEEAVSIAKEAYDRASAALRAALPSRTATPMSPSSTHNAPTPSAVAAPRSLMEAAMQGLERARRAS
jgi:hypothetical protein